MITFKSVPITFFTAHPHVGTKGIPAPLCALFSEEIRCHYIGKGLLFRLSKCSPSSAGICSLYSCCPGSSLVSFSLFPLSFIHMIKGLWFTHFFRDLNKTVTNPKRLTRLVTFGPSCISYRLTIRKLRSKTELLYVLMGEVGEHVRAFASEIHLKVRAPQRSSLPPQPQQTRSADQLRGRKRERERRDESMAVWCGTRDVKHAGISRVKHR